MSLKNIKKHYVAELDKKSINEEERTVTIVVSSEIVDRDGDVVKVAGINLKNYKKNPVVLWGHNSWSFPIAQATEISVDINKKQIIATAKFAETKEALELWGLVKDRFVRAVSIGFMPLESRLAGKHDKEVYGEKVNRIINKAELFELSFTNIPSNTEAIVTAVHKGQMTSDIAKKYFDIEVEPLLVVDKEIIKDGIKKEITKIEDHLNKEPEKKISKKEIIIDINNNKSYAKNKYKIEILRQKGQIFFKL